MMMNRLAGTGRMPNFPATAVSAAVYSAFPEINAIVHAHPTSVMALTAGIGPRATVLPISEPSFMFYERLASLPCNFFFDDEYLFNLVASMRESSEGVREGGGDNSPATKASSKYGVLMENHSYIMTGKDVPEAFLRSYMIEQAASVHYYYIWTCNPRFYSLMLPYEALCPPDYYYMDM